MPHLWSFLIHNTLIIAAALLPIINPVGQVPVFLSQTRMDTAATRNILARKVAIYSFFVILISLEIGSYVLDFFGISLAIVKLGGGLLVTSIGWSLLHPDESPKSSNEPDKPKYGSAFRKAFYPMTFPLTVGPGSISISITLGASVPDTKIEMFYWLIAGIAGACIIGVAVFLAYRFADKVSKLLGETGTHIFLQLSAFISFCVGLQIAWGGLMELAHQLQKSLAG
ncbi:NAAT family transporter [Leeia sp. TBRC 13508]|uniref:UPF0056 membrane protein n=1 Tax=Leeia speluncae TaxID=2884804 RepID=A0ABS8D2R0_9NEIS|nr:MarC family protein [Leeia speluncae]MCB6182465.1 NAAT family transporter [Leeia speluncae]